MSSHSHEITGTSNENFINFRFSMKTKLKNEGKEINN